MAKQIEEKEAPKQSAFIKGVEKALERNNAGKSPSVNKTIKAFIEKTFGDELLTGSNKAKFIKIETLEPSIESMRLQWDEARAVEFWNHLIGIQGRVNQGELTAESHLYPDVCGNLVCVLGDYYTTHGEFPNVD